jgi:hypothetical protein
MPRWTDEPLMDDPRVAVARRLLRQGMVNMAEAAALVGCTRQYMYKLARHLEPRRRRELYLKRLWREALDAEEA